MENFMTYTSDCWSRFTNGKDTRIQAFDIENLDIYRINLNDQASGIFISKLNLNGNFHSFKVSKI
jgi:hypothetical protein